MKKEGWIRLHRSITDTWLWKDEPYDRARAWIDLLLLANYEDKIALHRGNTVECKRGDVNLSILNLAQRWKWSRKKVTHFLKMLENDNMVTTKVTTTRTIITIVNYDIYQTVDGGKGTTESATEGTTEEQQKAQQRNTTKKDKEYKESKEINIPPISPQGGKAKAVKIYFDDAELDKAFKEYEAMRKRIKKPLTEGAITRAINKLHKLSDYPGTNELDIEKAKAIINQTVDHCWMDFYELKGDKQAKGDSENNEWLEMWRNA